MIVQGTTDVQVGVADAQRLAGARPDARLDLVEGMNHVLKSADGPAAAQKDAYADPNLPLAPKLVSDLVALLRPSALAL